jgi:trigger factor
MQVRIEDVSPVEKKLIVEVPWNTVNDKLSDMYRKLSKSVQLKGFRKGKVPLGVLQRMYGKHVKSEVAEQLVREGFLTATAEHNLDAVAEPKVSHLPDIKTGEPFAFEAIVEVKGEIEPKDYVGMPLIRRPLVVGEEEIDQSVEQLRQQHIELLPIEGRDITARTDVITLSIQGTIGDQTVDQPQVHIDLSDTEREPLPGFVQALIGLPTNVENHRIELAIPEDFQEESVAGKQASFTISIRDARQKHLPDLDDDFAKDVERGETLAELRQSIRADIEKQKKTQIDRELKEYTVRELVKRNQIPVASALVDRAVELQMQRLRSMFGMQLGRDALASLPPDFREQMRPQALEEIRGQLLLDAIAEKEGIAVSDADIDQYLNDFAKTRDQSPARLRAEYERDGKIESISFQLRQDKVLDFLIQRAVITEGEPPKPEDEASGAAEAGSGTEPAAP